MRMRLTRANERAEYNQDTGLFVGTNTLITFLNAYIRVLGSVGNNPFDRLVEEAENMNMTITEYQPDVYPQGTLDV